MKKTLLVFLFLLTVSTVSDQLMAQTQEPAQSAKDKTPVRNKQKKTKAPALPQDPFGDYMKAKLNDYNRTMGDPAKVRVELVQYFGKRERNYINHLVRNIEPSSIAQFQYNHGMFQVLINGKILELKVESMLLQKYALNDFTFQIKEFDSLKSLLEKIDSKLNVMLNVYHPRPWSLLINQAYAQTQFQSDTASLSLVVFLIQLVHGKSDTCTEGYLTYLQELGRFYNNCQSEIKDFNPQNIPSVTETIQSWNKITEIFYLNSQNPCQDIGAYLDNENSLKCDYAQSLTQEGDELCGVIFQINSCVEQLLKMVKKR
jgi:hypothetical protein